MSEAMSANQVARRPDGALSATRVIAGVMLSSTKEDAAVVSTKAMVRAPKPNILFRPFVEAKRERKRRQRQDGADDSEPEQHLGDWLPGDDVGEQPGADKAQACSDLRQPAVEGFIDAEHVDREPTVALPYSRCGAIEEEENDERGEENPPPMLFIYVLGDTREHQSKDGYCASDPARRIDVLTRPSFFANGWQTRPR
jgi:hypothetical protein